jgi:hypothetical protein
MNLSALFLQMMNLMGKWRIAGLIIKFYLDRNKKSLKNQRQSLKYVDMLEFSDYISN